MKKRRFISTVLLSTALVGLAGCAGTAPQYQAANSNVQALAIGSGKVGVDNFALGPKGDSLNHLSIRGGTYDSPVEKSWAVYLREALKAELNTSGRLDQRSDVKVSGTFLENDLNGSGFSTGTAHISANIVVKRARAVTYERSISADKQWESSVIGAIAIPRARQSYVATISELLGKLFSDQEFLRAIK